jgi:hypothetical protein
VLDYFMESKDWIQFLKKDGNEDDRKEVENFQHFNDPIGVYIPSLSLLINACLGKSTGMLTRILKENIIKDTGTA